MDPLRRLRCFWRTYHGPDYDERTTVRDLQRGFYRCRCGKRVSMDEAASYAAHRRLLGDARETEPPRTVEIRLLALVPIVGGMSAAIALNGIGILLGEGLR